MNRTALLALLSLVAAVALATAAVPASSPPKPLCSVCDSGFERAAEERGLDGNVTESAVEVVVERDGTARWTVRNRLGNESAADRLRENSGLLDAIVAGALDHGRPERSRVSDVSSRVAEETVVVSFGYDSFAERTWGDALVVDYFHTQGGRESYGLDADRFEVVGPEGTAVVNDPASGRVGEGRVTWVSDASHWGRIDESVPDTYVAFASRDGLVPTAAAGVAFAVRALPAVADNLLTLVPAALALVGGLAGLLRARRVWWIPRRQARRASAAVLGVGLLGIAHPLFAGTVPLLGGSIGALSAAGVVYALSGGLSLAVGRRGSAVPWWWLLAPGVGVLAYAGVLVATPGHPTSVGAVSGSVLLALPLATAFPLGYAVGRDDPREKRRALAVTVVAVGGVALQSVSFTSEPFAGGLLAILAFALVAVGLLFALPLALLGDLLSRTLETDV